ncbi:MAG: hypothetical protein HYY24_06700 [Verrucomicrobia bacterium]|nr:hypothetical protein [Verrucomicrobiota bacterium]
MIGLGTTLRCNLAPRHIWIVLSDPAQTGGRILLANLTTLTEGCVDDACVLSPADYSLLTHATTVAYSRAQTGTAAILQELVDDGDFRVITPIPATTLAKILEAAQRTRELSDSQKELVAAVA